MASSTSKALKMEDSRQVSTCDRLSKLPDSVVIHILSFLPTFDAVYRAGFVSKRWASLRLSLPSLVFQMNDIPSGPRHYNVDDKFRRLINDLLIFQDRDNLRRCCFHLPYYGYTRDQEVDTWIQLALHRKVKELQLLFKTDSRNYYCLPRFFFRNEILTSLSLSNVEVKVGKEMKINWKSLKSLSMKHIANLDDDMLGKILIGCPILELLELNSCKGIKKLDVVSQTLKEFVFHDCVYSHDKNQRGEILRVSVPSLRVLVISGSNRFDKCTIENSSSLVEATMFFESFWHDNDNYDSYSDNDNDNGEDEDDEDGYEYDDGIDFFGSVQHVKKLTLLGTWNLHVQSTKPWAYSFSNCKSLTLDINLMKWELPGLAIMLQNCPELESLTMDMTTPRSTKLDCKCHKFDFEGKNFWLSDPSYVNLNCLLGHLKTVKIVGALPLRGGELVVEFLRFILKHAKVLERLSICIDEKAGKKQDEESLFQLSVFHMLLNFPRSSISAVIEVISSHPNKRLSSQTST